MKQIVIAFLLVCSQDIAATQSPAGRAKSNEQIRHIIRGSRHLGAHGVGYSDQSLKTLSRKLTPADVPALINLLADRDLRVGVEFALASQCEAAMAPIREAAVQHKMSYLDAEDAMSLMEGFSGCGPASQQKASTMRAEIHTLGEAEEAKLAREAQERAAEDARIQRNALKMTDPKQATELTRQEREEVYRRSLKAMGLNEDGPMTPAQKDLVQRMYRTMVLGESGDRPPN